MNALAVLAVVALSLGAGAGPVLSRSAWCQRIPRVAAPAWLGVLAGALAACLRRLARRDAVLLLKRRGDGFSAAPARQACSYKC